MLNFGILLRLLTIAAFIFGSVDSSDGELSRSNCPQIDSSLNFTLDLAFVGLQRVSDKFIKNEFLTTLILDYNEISTITSETFLYTPKLTHLSLADNRLTSFNLEPFSKLSKLKTLNLNNNYGKQPLAEYYTYHHDDSHELKIETDFHSLTHLYVRNNQIKKISVDGFNRFPALTYLDLSENNLHFNKEHMLGFEEQMPALTHLFLNNCQLPKFNVSYFKTLTSLYLDGNDIASICNEYCQAYSHLNLNLATQLTILSVSGNKIERIKVDSFKNTTNLVTLDLSHNHISNIIEGTFDRLTVLEYLNLEHNHFTRLNAVRISNQLVRLNSLLLGNNEMRSVSSKDFENMLIPETLKLNDNQISIIKPGAFSNLTSLKNLSLASNNLLNIPADSMPTSGSLLHLDLDRNKFTSIENISIANISSLISVSLRGNPLETLTANWFKDAPKNLIISISPSLFLEFP